VGVARALAADPPLLLLDEPFGALDPITRVELQREFAALEGRLGKGMVFVTHDVREGLVLGTRIGRMLQGRLVFLGTPDEFRRSAAPCSVRRTCSRRCRASRCSGSLFPCRSSAASARRPPSSRSSYTRSCPSFATRTWGSPGWTPRCERRGGGWA